MTAYLSNRRWLIAGALLAPVVALAVACGGGGKASDSGPPGGPPGDVEAVTGQGRANDTFAAEQGGALSAGVTQPASRGEFQSKPPAESDGGESGGSLPLPSQIDQKIVRVATLNVTTEKASENFENIGNIAAAAGGYVSSSTFGREEEQQTASVTIKVPSERYQDVLVQLRDLGEVRREESNANNVTEEYTDLNSRLRNLRATELQYLEFLKRAEDIGTVLQIQDRINATRLEIEQVQGRIDLLDNISALATITVHLAPPIAAKAEEPKDEANTPIEVAEEAFEASLTVLLGIATVALAVAAFSWWLLPLLAGGYIVGRRALRDQQRATPPHPPAPAQ